MIRWLRCFFGFHCGEICPRFMGRAVWTCCMNEVRR